MDLLKREFSKHDGKGSGQVPATSFENTLIKFGIRDGLQPVIKRFAVGSDKVDYRSFLEHFESKHGSSTGRPLHGADPATPRRASQTQNRERLKMASSFRRHDTNATGLVSSEQLESVLTSSVHPTEMNRMRHAMKGFINQDGTFRYKDFMSNLAGGDMRQPYIDAHVPYEDQKPLYHGSAREPAQANQRGPKSEAPPEPCSVQQGGRSHSAPSTPRADRAVPAAPSTPRSLPIQRANEESMVHISQLSHPKVSSEVLSRVADKELRKVDSSRLEQELAARSEEKGGLSADDVGEAVSASMKGCEPWVAKRAVELASGMDEIQPKTVVEQLSGVGTQRNVSFQGGDRDDSIVVLRGEARAIDAHRSDSGSLAAFALGEVADSKVDYFGLSHTGRRRRGAPLVPAHASSLPVGSVASLGGAGEPSDSEHHSRRGRGTSTQASPARRFDLINGRVHSEIPPAPDEMKVEGRRHIVPPPRDQTPRRTIGLRTFGEDGRQYRDGHERSTTPRGLRSLRGKASESHFAVGITGSPASGEMTWPQGSPRCCRITPSTTSSIPGLCQPTGADEPRLLQRKARTAEPSSFGVPSKDPRDLSPRPTRPASSTPGDLKRHVASRVNTTSPSVTKAWIELSKSVGQTGKSEMSPERFSEACRTKLSVDITPAEVERMTSNPSGKVTFNDFNRICGPDADDAALIKKEPQGPLRMRGRKCGPPDSPSAPFAMTSGISQTPSPARRARSAGPSGRIGDHKQSLHVDADHYITTNMRTFSPVRQISGTEPPAGFPNRLRDDSQRRRRCYSPGFSNRESLGNPITHL